MTDAVEKAAILQEALPYIREFHGKVFVVKYGGHAMVNEALRNSFARDLVLLKYVGVHPVVVHGGGPQIDATLAQLGVVSERLDGLRVTDARTMEVVEMVLGGRLNSEIVSLIGRQGGRAVGLTGKDDNFLRAERLTEIRSQSGQQVDPGRVGRVVEVRTTVVERLVEGGFIPVIAPIAVDAEGESLNVNADLVASAVAGALRARKLVLMTDTPGVKDAAGEVIPSLDRTALRRLIGEGVIAGGMIPKVECALEALEAGVRKAHIIDGRALHAVLLEIFTRAGVGTEVTRPLTVPPPEA